MKRTTDPLRLHVYLCYTWPRRAYSIECNEHSVVQQQLRLRLHVLKEKDSDLNPSSEQKSTLLDLISRSELQKEKHLGVKWEKDLKAFGLKSTWMIKLSSFDVELKFEQIRSHGVCDWQVDTERGVQRDAREHRLLTAGEKHCGFITDMS